MAVAVKIAKVLTKQAQEWLSAVDAGKDPLDAAHEIWALGGPADYRVKVSALLASPVVIAEARRRNIQLPGQQESDQERLETIRDAHMSLVRASGTDPREKAASAKAARDAMRDLSALNTSTYEIDTREEVLAYLAELRQ